VVPQTKTRSQWLRVKPTRSHMDALVGTWELGGETIQMMEEPGTGTLVALNSRGEAVNPVRVISQGSKR
jgi:hypothetical protein